MATQPSNGAGEVAGKFHALRGDDDRSTGHAAGLDDAAGAAPRRASVSMEPMQVDASEVRAQAPARVRRCASLWACCTPVTALCVIDVLYRVLAVAYVACAARLAVQRNLLHGMVPTPLIDIPVALLGALVLAAAAPAIYGTGPERLWRSGRGCTPARWRLVCRLLWSTLLSLIEVHAADAFTSTLDDTLHEFMQEPDGTINVYMKRSWHAVLVARDLMDTSFVLVEAMAVLATVQLLCEAVRGARHECGAACCCSPAKGRRRYQRNGFCWCCCGLWRCCCGCCCGEATADLCTCACGDAAAYAPQLDVGEAERGIGAARSSLVPHEPRGGGGTPDAPSCSGRLGQCVAPLTGKAQLLAATAHCAMVLACVAGVTMGAHALWLGTRAQPEWVVQEDAGVGSSQCDPLVPSLCALPFPSSYFLTDDASTGTGYRVNLGPASLPSVRWGGHVSPAAWNEADGFSTIAPLLFVFDDAVDADLSRLVPAWNIGLYNASNVTTVLVDTVTGHRVPHWVEIDAYSPDYGASAEYTAPDGTSVALQPLIILQPAEPLLHNRRYAVGVRGFRSAAGVLVRSSQGFDALRSAATSGASDPRAAHFRTVVFPALAAAGFSDSTELQLAWDFVTVSKVNSLGRVTSMRDDALAAVGIDGAAYDIDHVESMTAAECSAAVTSGGRRVARWVWGHFQGPQYMRSAGPGVSSLTGAASDTSLGGRPAPVRNGDVRVNFLLLVPCDLVYPGADGTPPPQAQRLVQFGHGLFGERSELRQRWLDDIANRYKWVVFATDWEGMSFVDVPTALRIFLTDLSAFRSVPERTSQAFVNKAVMLRTMRGRLAADPALATASGARIVGAGAEVVYMGNSQGAILGGGYAAMSTDLHRVVLGETGANYALILSRSVDFGTYYAVLKFQLYSQRDVRLMLTVAQQLWDMGEGAGWLRSMNQEPMPGCTPKTVILQCAMGDAQVTPVAGHVQARAYGASTLTPQLRPVFGVPPRMPPLVDGGGNASVLVEYQFGGVPPAPRNNTPAQRRTDTHECVKDVVWAQEQVASFYDQGVISNYCAGEPDGATCRVTKCPWHGWDRQVAAGNDNHGGLFRR